jgi:hypothetical protein
MRLNVKAKQVGRKHPLIDTKPIEIDDIGTQPSVSQLILAVVKQQVTAYNQKPLEKNLLPFLDKNEIDGQAATGKVGFGSIYNENKADLPIAQSTALQAFEDGLFALFVNEEECSSLEQTITLEEDTVITFIRLTFLAGSYW